VQQEAAVRPANFALTGLMTRSAALFAFPGGVDRNHALKEWAARVVDTTDAMWGMAAIRVDFAFTDPELLVDERLLLETVRHAMASLDGASGYSSMIRAELPHHFTSFQQALRAARENMRDLRIALALLLGARDELEELGWTPRAQAPLGTRGPSMTIEELERELA